jgi:hypothetical protein
MSYIKRLTQKIRYNNILRILHDGLVKIGIHLSLFYWVEEGLHLQSIPIGFNEFSDYTVELLKENELNIIADIPEKPYKTEILTKRIKEGSGCLLFKKKNKVVGYTWFNLSRCSTFFYDRHLNENEAYLFDAYVLMDFRGKTIAPFVRYQCYKELHKLNKTVLYSISDFFNNQSIRFKKKLNAKFLYLMLYINLFNKFTFSRTIKRFY